MKTKKLMGDVNCDVLVIGAGMAGLLCAYEISRQGADCIVCEAECAGGGVSGSTTGKVTAQHGLCYASLLENIGKEGARTYLHSNLEAVERLRSLCSENDALWEEVPSFVYSEKDRQKLENEHLALKQLGYDAPIQEKLPLPFPTSGGICFPRQGQIDAPELMEKLAAKLDIYEHTPVRKVSPGKACTDNAVIHADSIIIATHFPFIIRYGLYFLKMYQERSWFVAAEGCQDVEGMYIGEGGGLSFRNMGNTLYVGGAAARTGKKSRAWESAEELISHCYPNAKIKYKWATQDCITLDGMPYIGRYSKAVPGLYVATGFNKWGMTGSMLSAMILSDTVNGRKNEYESLYSPHRSVLKKRAVTNLGETLSGLISFKRPRCPHMGCALQWNPHENSWDCPCHGSRFDADGELIIGPAKRDMNAAADNSRYK